MMTTKITWVLLALAVFTAGLSVGSLLGGTDMFAQTQVISSRNLNVGTILAEPSASEEVLSAAVGPVQFENRERDSPSDWVAERQIEMRPDGVLLKINNPQWAVFADTNSMDPVFDAGSHAIQIIPTSQDQIKVGDIISYDSSLGFSIIHRVIEIGTDAEGWYVITKGDNNPTPDPWKIRWNQVTRVTVALVY